MPETKKVLKERALILLVLAMLLTFFGIWVALHEKGEGFRLLTAHHSVWADYLFRYFTHLGDGIFIIALAALLAFRRRYFLTVGITAGYLLSGLFAQLGKNILNMPRPKAWFEALGETVYQVPGVEVHMSGSFPSGHTASVFALAVFLILVLPFRWYSWLILLFACGVGYSRIYISQHFPLDVLAGGLIGTFSGIVVYLWMRNSKYLKSKFQ